MPTVLVVDDDDIIRQAIVGMLGTLSAEDTEYAFLEAADGHLALEAVARNEVDCILLDVKMPTLDGYEVCRHLKSHPVHRDIPIIFLTGHATDDRHRIRGLELGADDFLGKPVSMMELRARVRNMVRTRLAEKEVRKKTEQLQELLQNRERELQHIRTEYLGFLEGGIDLITEIREDGGVIYVNRLHESLLGYPVEQLKGMKVQDLLPSEHLALFADAFRRAAAGEERTPVDLDLVARSGHRLPVEVRLSRLVDTPGEARFRMVSKDIRQRRALERELRQRVEELERLNEYKTRFLAGMSHEFFTPLMSILNFIRFVVDDREQPPSPRHREDLSKALVSAEYLEELLSVVLDISQVELGQISIHPEEVELGEILRKVTITVEPMMKEKQLDLVLDLPPEPLLLVSDGLRLKQILINLLSNACRYTDTGRITVRVELREGWVHVHVEDTGIGIAEDRLDEIFEEFRQVHDTSRRPGGRGLGLTLSRRLAHLVGGDIAVSSRAGAGTTFTLALPREWDRQPTPALPRDHWVLVAIEDAERRQSAEDRLRRQGLQVVSVGRDAHAHRILERGSPVAVLAQPGLGRATGEPRRRDVVPVWTLGVTPGAPVADPFLLPAGSIEDPRDLASRIPSFWIRHACRGPGKTFLVGEDLGFLRWAQDLFRRSGATVETFVQGAEFLQQVLETRAALILADLRLQDMNGFDLIERLLAIPFLRRVPIVILTNQELSPVEKKWFLARTHGIMSKTQRALERALEDM